MYLVYGVNPKADFHNRLAMSGDKILCVSAFISKIRYNLLMIDHDRLFKELLTNFLREFIELFFPDVSAYWERDSVEFLPQ